jgi:L-aspartate oxidase
MKSEQTDFLVIGSGIAGLSFALKMANRGKVTIITKKHSAESNTNYAQGGIAAVMQTEANHAVIANSGIADSFTRHGEDTLIAGAGICDPNIVKMVVEEGAARVSELMAIGAEFTTEHGALHLGMEGGHSAHRIVHAADRTGQEVERSLLEAVQNHPDITIKEYHFCLDLWVSHAGCHGVIAVDERTGEVEAIRARVTLLASGGSGQVYQHTSNPAIATGDGVAMAYRAGARIANMEFFQFHPTCLYHPAAKSFLISEAVRGAGGVLRNQAGERFMPSYHSSAELAPRDIVARAIDDQLKQRHEEYVLLDISHLPKAEIAAHFPSILETCQSFGIDITAEPIPVVPAAHYQCGGVITNAKAETSISNLLACGEVAYTGLHGANRLASNSLLEALVFSHHAVETAARLAATSPSPHEESPALEAWWYKQQAWQLDAATTQNVTHIREARRSLMWQQVGIVRTNARLAEAINQLEIFKQETSGLYQQFPLAVAVNELRNLLDVALLITRSALRRQESRGLHYLLDQPQPRASFARPTIL